MPWRLHWLDRDKILIARLPQRQLPKTIYVTSITWRLHSLPNPALVKLAKEIAGILGHKSNCQLERSTRFIHQKARRLSEGYIRTKNPNHTGIGTQLSVKGLPNPFYEVCTSEKMKECSVKFQGGFRYVRTSDSYVRTAIVLGSIKLKRNYDLSCFSRKIQTRKNQLLLASASRFQIQLL